jgi:hypothetical protein
MRKKLTLLLTSSLLLSAPALADVHINGFASFYGGTASDETPIDGYTNDVDFNTDSLFALQASADLGEGLSAVAQMVSRGRNDWDMDMEWAYLSYQINDAWRINAGRMRVPYFAYSDFIDVGYAYPWIAPPTSVYDLPSDRYEGIALSYSTYLGDVEVDVEMIGGTNEQVLTILGQETRFRLDQLVGGSATATQGDWQWRASYYQTDATAETETLNQLAGLWRATPYPNIADALILDDERLTFIGASMRYDDGRWLALSEYTLVDYGDSIFPDDAQSYFVTAGYRHGDTLLHITYGANSENDIVRGLDAVNVAPLAELRSATERASATFMNDKHYWQVGLRHDFHESAALKLEWKREMNHLSNTDATLLRAGVSLIF